MHKQDCRYNLDYRAPINVDLFMLYYISFECSLLHVGENVVPASDGSG